MMKPKVVVIGIGFATRLGIIRSLAEITDDICVIMIENEQSKPIDCYSKYVKQYYCSGNDENKLIRIITEKCSDNNQKVVLIPTNDFSASVLDRHIDELKDHFLFPHIHNKQGAITDWMDKERQKALAKEVMLNVANSSVIDIINEKYDLPANINYPCFTKTLKCNTTGYKHTLHRCNDEKELRTFLDHLGKRFQTITIMVEDYKEIETEFAVVGFSNGKEVIIPGVIEITNMAKGLYSGIACQGKIMPIGDFKGIVEQFKAMIRKIGFTGLFDIDFYRSEGLLYFGEINLRMGGSGYSVTKKGINLPCMLVQHLTGAPMSNSGQEIKSTSTFANERMCLDNWYKGFISTKEYRHIVQTSDISFLRDKDDRKPEIIYNRSFAVLRMKRFLKKVLRK